MDGFRWLVYVTADAYCLGVLGFGVYCWWRLCFWAGGKLADWVYGPEVERLQELVDELEAQRWQRLADRAERN